ncbi:MAG: hypothetical protein P8H38_02600 [Flavobacteriaceae bacterium]|nr:hypothetical protein [Flavobacteriaceae bacterium]
MIRFDENEVGKISVEQFLKCRALCIERLKNEPSFDLILDSTNSSLPYEELSELNSLLLSKSRVLVVIVATDQMEDLYSEWNLVPTIQEAEDFISFERMQRDLGF